MIDQPKPAALKILIGIPESSYFLIGDIEIDYMNVNNNLTHIMDKADSSHQSSL